MNLQDFHEVFQRKETLMKAKLLASIETSEIVQFLFLIGSNKGNFIKFQMKFFIKKLKEYIKKKNLLVVDEIKNTDFLLIEVINYIHLNQLIKI